MRSILGEAFFLRPPQRVARELLGKFLVRRIDDKEIGLMITETEAYDGEHDLACHARSGFTRRNAPMWGKPGRAYIYFTYGMHWMFNIVTREEGYPSAVLIRGAGEYMGPARLTKGLLIDKKLNDMPLARRSGLWIEDRGASIAPARIERTPRMGVAYAGEYAEKEWRFVITSSPSRFSR